MFNMGRRLFRLPATMLTAFIPSSSILDNSNQTEVKSTLPIARKESISRTTSSDEKLRDPPPDEEKDVSEPLLIPYPSTLPEKFAALPEPEQWVLFYLGYFYCGLYLFFKEPPPSYTALSGYVSNLVDTYDVLCSQVSSLPTGNSSRKAAPDYLERLKELQWTQTSTASNLKAVRNRLTEIAELGWFPLFGFSSSMEESPFVQFAKVLRGENDLKALRENKKDLLLTRYRLAFGNDFPINLVEAIHFRILSIAEKAKLERWLNSLPSVLPQDIKNQIKKEAYTLLINEKQRQWCVKDSKLEICPEQILTESKTAQIEFSKAMEKIGWLIILNDGISYMVTQKKMIAYGILIGFLLAAAVLTLALVYSPAGLFTSAATIAAGGCAILAGALGGAAAVKVACATQSFRFGIFDKPSHIQFKTDHSKPDKEFDAAFGLFCCNQKQPMK